eukprot:g46027.t1
MYWGNGLMPCKQMRLAPSTLWQPQRMQQEAVPHAASPSQAVWRSLPNPLTHFWSLRSLQSSALPPSRHPSLFVTVNSERIMDSLAQSY